MGSVPGENLSEGTERMEEAQAVLREAWRQTGHRKPRERDKMVLKVEGKGWCWK